MHGCLKAAGAALLAATTLALFVGAAPANRLRASELLYRVVWSEMTISEIGGSVRCAITLEGTLDNLVFAKSFRARVGEVSSARSGCRAIEFLATLPWDVLYQGFLGTLPNITTWRIYVLGFAFRWIGSFISCLYRSDARGNTLGFSFRRNTGTAQLTSVEPEGSLMSEGSAFCNASATLRGSGVLTIQGEGEAIYLTLEI